MKKSTWLMFLFRAIYLGLIIALVFLHDWTGVIINGLTFLLTMLVPLLGKEKYYAADAYLIAIFLSFIAMSIFLPGLANTMRNPGIGIDDPFHFLGGTALGWIGYLYFRSTKKVVIGALIITIGWEILEFATSLPPLNAFHAGLIDTLLDILWGTLGAGIVAYLNGRADRKQ